MKTLPTTLISLLLWPGALLSETIRVPEDRGSIQEAIDAAVAGDIVEVASGIYRERIKLKPGITVRSAGPEGRGELGLKRAEATMIDGGGAAGESPGVTMAEGAVFDGFTVTNVGRYEEEAWQKNWEERGQNQPHEHIGGFGVPGIAVTGDTCKVLNNIVHHNGDTGIAIQGAKAKRCSPEVAGNVCYRNMGGGIGSMKGSTALIDGNTCFENFYAGIGHDNAAPLVTRNVCYGNIRAGIGVSEGARPVVRQNRCYENRRAGIGIRTGAATRPVVEDNDCYENGMAGIGSEEGAAPVIRGNRCYRNRLAGIGCRDGSTSLVLENHCYENGEAGIGVASATGLLFENRIERNKTAGIGIDGESKVQVIGNTCEENRLVAVGVPKGGEVFLQDNTLSRAGGPAPIVAILGGSKAILIGNTIRGGGVAGVMVAGRLKAIGNVMEGEDRGSGIWAREGSEVILSGNRISGYKTPLRDQGAKSVVVGEEQKETAGE